MDNNELYTILMELADKLNTLYNKLDIIATHLGV